MTDKQRIIENCVIYMNNTSRIFLEKDDVFNNNFIINDMNIKIISEDDYGVVLRIERFTLDGITIDEQHQR